MELWWNCLEFIFHPRVYIFQAVMDEFQIPAHMYNVMHVLKKYRNFLLFTFFLSEVFGNSHGVQVSKYNKVPPAPRSVEGRGFPY